MTVYICIQVIDTCIPTSYTSSVKTALEAEIKDRINEHLFELTIVRKQAGFISSPSNDIIQAERRLSEVHTCVALKVSIVILFLYLYLQGCMRT